MGGQCADIQIIGNPLTIPRPKSLSYRKKKQILFVGSFNTWKGLRYLLPIWKKFNRTNSDSWELVMLGEQGNERGFVEDFIAKEKLKNIRLDRPTDKISQYYEESAILIMTSIFEGFPLVLAEAMSRGCVPIAFDSFSSIHDIIEPEQNGILVTPFNVDEFVSKLSTLARDDEQRKLLSDNAIKVVDRFDLDRIGSKWEDMFYNLSQKTN